MKAFKPASRRFTVVAGEPLSLPPVKLVPADAVLVLASDPPGAAVTVDGKWRGETPLELVVAPRRGLEVKVTKAGHEDATLKVEIAPGERREGDRVRAHGHRVADQHGPLYIGMNLHLIDDAEDGEPGAVHIESRHRVEVFDAEPIGGNRPEDHGRNSGGRLVDEAAFSHVGPEYLQEIGVGGQNGDTSGFQFRYQVVAPHRGGGPGGRGDLLYRPDPLRHRRSFLRYLAARAEDAGARFDAKQVGS